MRVVFYSECPNVASGFGKVTYYLTKGLIGQGFDVVNLCMAVFGPVRSVEGFKVFPAPPTAQDIVQRWTPDYVIFFGAPWIVPLNQILPTVPAAVAINRRVRFLGYFVHEFIEAPESVKAYFRPVHLLILTAAAEAKPIGADPDRYVVVPHAVNGDLFNPDVRPDQDVRAALGVKHVIGMVSKNHPRKRFDMFLQLIAMLTKSPGSVAGLPYTTSNGVWDLNLIAEGWSRLYGVEPKLIRMQDYDMFFGLPEDMEARAFANMTIHTLITQGEAFSLPVLETLSLGIPNVVIDTEVFREVYGDAVEYVRPAGHIISPREGTVHYMPDVQGYYEKVVEIINHYDEYKEKALRASEELRKRYTWEAATKLLVQAIDRSNRYDYLISGSVPPTPPAVMPQLGKPIIGL